MDTPLRVFSFGGGVQSTAALVLAAERKIDYPTFVFANVGADSENPATLDYIAEIAGPYAEQHGIELLELDRIPRKGRFKGQTETLLGRLMHPDSRSVGIPVRMPGGAPGRRSCTYDFKIVVVDQLLKQRGATKEQPAIVGIGFSTDEIHRAGSTVDPRQPRRIKDYPLLTLGLSRSDCLAIITNAGLPQPQKSSCWFCPFHSKTEWQRLHREEPVLFAKSCDLEDAMNERRARLGKDSVYLSDYRRPLRDVFTAGTQLTLDQRGDAGCDTGYCFH
jgi:hypothetical protein